MLEALEDSFRTPVEIFPNLAAFLGFSFKISKLISEKVNRFTNHTFSRTDLLLG